MRRKTAADDKVPLRYARKIFYSGGLYLFANLVPGNYMVEIVSKDQTAMASTQLISANAGAVPSSSTLIFAAAT